MLSSMEQALTLGMTRQELIDTNLVRIYLWEGTSHSWSPQQTTFARQEPLTRYQRGLWRRLLRSFLHPSATSASLLLLTSLGSWISESTTMRWGAMLWESNLYRSDPSIRRGDASNTRHISVHFPRRLVPTDASSGTYYDVKPDWYSATIPQLATPTDIEGRQIWMVSGSPSDVAGTAAAPARSFQERIQQLPPTERRLLSSPNLAKCDAEQVSLQYLQLKCTPLVIGTDGGKRHNNGAFSWILCSPGEEQLVLNSGPLDGWHWCQSLLCSEAAAIASLILYVDEFATYHQVDIRCTFCLHADSTSSAVSNIKTLRDIIPTPRFPNHTDILSSMSSPHYVLEHFRLLTHVHSHQNKSMELHEMQPPRNRRLINISRRV